MSQQAALSARGGTPAPAAGTLHVGAIGVAFYLAIVAQLALVVLLLRQYQIESGAFLRLAVLAFGGFAVHALLPMAWRLPLFLLLSIVGIFVAIDIANALWLIGCGLALIGICHLRASFAVRGWLLVAAGALLALLRAKWLPGPVPEAIWPILGSMFMFRLIAYLYDLRHDTAPVSPVRTLSYFFLLPNVCFPLFPVVDFKTFRRNYYDDDAYRVYQLGIDWMVRGVIHLLLYRFVYYHLTLAPHEVVNPATLSQYLVANFLLYLRVSGLFHLIIGMLCLFGFRLPETHNRYLLASSFTDFWRRINIYWKDFMQKVFYYPALFRLRKLGTTTAMVVATLFVFVLTWFLHAYQWFWLRGTTLFVPQDILFWTILGALVVVNALYEVKYGRKRSLGSTMQTPGELASLVARRYATFWAICILWSFWTAESVSDWLGLWSALRGTFTWQVLVLPVVVLAVIVLGSIERSGVRNVKSSAQSARQVAISRVVTVVSMLVLIGISPESVNRMFGAEVGSTLMSLRSGKLSRLDSAKLERGYYESLLSVDRFNSQLWEVYSKRPASWLDTQHAQLKRFTDDFAGSELIPSFVSHSNYGTISINRWGMRDRDYALVPPADTFRIALLGPSNVMGWGVGDGETFEALLETKLDAARGSGPRIEILNFGIPGLQPMQQVVVAEKTLRFAPDALYYVATGRELSRNAAHLAGVVRAKSSLPYAELRDIAREAGLEPTMDETEAVRRLLPYRERLLAWTYGSIVATARKAGARPVLIFLPQVREGDWQEETEGQLRIAQEAGFTVISLADVYRQQDVNALRVAEWDEHPNRLAHTLIASRLFDAIMADRAVIERTGPKPSTTSAATKP